MPQLGWIGLGNMGKGMVKNLVEKGPLDKPLLIYNRTRSRADEFAKTLPAGKTNVVASPAEIAAASDIIFTALGDDKAITDCVAAMLEADVKGKLIVDTTTVHPDTANALANTIKGKGAHFVACPVFGAPAMANAGQLVTVLAGPQSDIDKVLPYTKGVIARENIIFPGEDYGRSLLLKVVGNAMVFQMIEALAEAHTVAEKSGLGHQQLHDFISLMFPGPYVAYSNRMMQGDHVRESPLFQIDLALKDARHALDLAKRSGSSVPATELVNKHFHEVKAAQGEKGDVAGLYGAIRSQSGLPYASK